MKKIILAVIASSLILTSCSNSDSFENENTNNKLQKNNLTSVQRITNLENDLNTFAINHINISNEINDLVNQNSNIDFSKISFNDLEVSKSETDLKISLESAGIQNSDLLIITLKKQIDNFKNNLADNEEFIRLNLSEQNSMIINAINNNLSQTDIAGKRSCVQQWKVDGDRCTRNYYWAGGLAVVGTFATGGWGLLGVVGAVAQYHDCLSDALDDYRDCKNP